MRKRQSWLASEAAAQKDRGRRHSGSRGDGGPVDGKRNLDEQTSYKLQVTTTATGGLSGQRPEGG